MNQAPTSTKPRLFRKSKSDKKVNSHYSQKKLDIPNKVDYSIKGLELIQKKKSKSHKLPNISRVITELRLFKLLRYSLAIVLIVLTIFFNWVTLQNLYLSGKSWITLQNKRNELFNKMQLWNNITREYPNYRDAYFEGGLYAYQLSDKKSEEYFLTQTQFLDPNFKFTKTLGKLINLQSINK